MRKKVLILAGAPGAGKGTIKQKIMQIWEKEGKTFSNLETSAILKKDTKFQEIIARGDLVKDEDVICALQGPLQTAKENIMLDNIILDGFPRTIAQAEALKKMLAERGQDVSVMLDLEVPEDELMTRLIKRGKDSGRADDNEETIKKRLHVYHSQTAPLIDWYKNEKLYAHIKGIGELETITADVCKAIDAAK